MRESHWRVKSREIIAAIVTKNLPEAERDRAIREAYPFGERRMYPYKIWLDEVRRQTGKHRTKPAISEREQIEAGQSKMF